MKNRDGVHRTALVVDVDPAIVQLLDEVLTQAGSEVTSFTHCHPALDTLWHRTFTVLRTDHWLPDVNGAYLCGAAREQHGLEPAIFIVSAHPGRDRHTRMMELGADGCV